MATYPIQPGSTHSSVLEGIRDSGNRTAWERFYGQYAPFVHALAVRNGLRHADADDLVQTVFAEMAGRMRTFDYDREKAEAAIREAKAMPGISLVRVWLNRGTLKTGDDIMIVLIGGDIRPRVVACLEFLVGKLKSECVTEKELF